MAIDYLVLFTTPAGQSSWHKHSVEQELQIGDKISLDDVVGPCEVLNAWEDLDGQALAFTVGYPKEQFKPEWPDR